MGFDCDRFETVIDEELICSICSGVFDDPVQIESCEHTFCRQCIKQWCMRQSTCPVDRKVISITQLQVVPRILLIMLGRLHIQCDNFAHGCQNYMLLDQLSAHIKSCHYDPKRPVPCPRNCGLNVPKDELQQHNCARELRKLICELAAEMQTMRQVSKAQDRVLQILHQDLVHVKDSIKLLKELNPSIIVRIDREELLKWSRKLMRALVIDWTNIVANPNERTKILIRSALIKYNCPSRYIPDLVKNCHEDNWPRSLRSACARELNHCLLDDYICRRLLGHTVLLVLSIENGHMSGDMMTEPGIIICLHNAFH